MYGSPSCPEWQSTLLRNNPPKSRAGGWLRGGTSWVSMFLPDPQVPTRQQTRDDDESAPVEPVADRVEAHALSINAKVSNRQLRKLMSSIFEEAHGSFCNGDMDTALDGFAHCLALDDFTGGRDASFTNSLLYNIGAGLHFLGEFEEAQEWYERALEGLEQENGFFMNLFFSEGTAVRQSLTSSRLEEARNGLMPGQGRHLGASSSFGSGAADSVDFSSSAEASVSKPPPASVSITIEPVDEDTSSLPSVSTADKAADASAAAVDSASAAAARAAQRASTSLPPAERLPPPSDAEPSGSHPPRAAKPPVSPPKPCKVDTRRTTVGPLSASHAPTSPVAPERAPVVPIGLWGWMTQLKELLLGRSWRAPGYTHTAVPTHQAWPEHEGAEADGADLEAAHPLSAERYELNYEEQAAAAPDAAGEQDDRPLPPRAARLSSTGHGGDDEDSTGGGGDDDAIAVSKTMGKAEGEAEGKAEGEEGEEPEKELTHKEALDQMHWLLRIFAPSEVELDLAASVAEQGYTYRGCGMASRGGFGGFGL